MNCTPDASRQKNGKSIIKEKDLKYHFKKGKKQKEYYIGISFYRE